MFAASKTASVSGGYQISRSLRFNSADSAYLNRTPASAGNRKQWSWSLWFKVATVGTEIHFFGASQNVCYLTTSSTLLFAFGATTYRITSQVFRDVSAWMHLVVVWDSPNATANDRLRFYINGVQVTAFSTNNTVTLNDDSGINSVTAHNIGRFYGGSDYFNGYMTEINFIDGQALTASSFGETNAQTGVWQPKAYSGSYGTNGFYLNFSDNSNTTAATLGKDYSGNGNNWTPNNFSVTAGAGNDSLVDSPTSYGTDTGVGGEVRGNYSTINPIDGVGFSAANGNLDVTVSSATGAALSTISMSSGKWYWEVVGTGGGAAYMVGVANASSAATTKSWQGANGWYYYGVNGQKYTNGSGTSYGSTYTTGVVIGVALDMDAGTVTFYRNGVSQGTAYSSFSGLTMQPSVSSATGNEQYSINFGQRPFAYTAPSGYKALCTQNLPTPTIGATTATQAGKYFNPVLYTGTNANQSISNLGFQPDFLWFKSRNLGRAHALFNSVMTRGFGLSSNTTGAEVAITAGNDLVSFDADGFSLGPVTNYNSVNGSGDTIVAWGWKANGSGSTNTSGSITSTVSANTTSGFSVVTYTGTGVTGATVGHGLGVAPSMIIVKSRSVAASWPVYHSSLGATKWLLLNSTNAATTNNQEWNNTAPTSTVFTIGNSSANSNQVATYVAYCFAEVAGYSKFGSWTGNGSSDGVFVYTGFRPAYVLIKGTNSSGYIWTVYDSKRNTYNAANLYLEPDASIAETTFTTLDFLSNGIKIRNSDSNFNASGSTYIFAAFAESPFKYSLAR